MNREQAATEVKRRYADYLKPAKVNGTYICPLCGNGTGSTGDGMRINPNSHGQELKCFKCGFYGDIVDLYQQEHGCSTAEAFSALYDYFGIKIDSQPTEADTDRNRKQATTNPPDERTAGGGENYLAYFKTCWPTKNAPEAVEYLKKRGISPDTAFQYGVGYDARDHFIIIPTSDRYYVARNIEAAAQNRYKNPKGAKIELFNAAALYNKDGRPVFIVEGAFDALSVIEAGGLAVSLNSTSNYRKLLEMLKEKPTTNTLILCLDNDTAGEKTEKDLAKGLEDIGITFIQEAICGENKDPNAALVNNRSLFLEAVQAAERHTKNPDNTSDYINRLMAGEIDRFRNDATRKTGFGNWDEAAGGIYSGLYAVGGISSVGKTTFIYQMADQMAKQGQHVLFFSMEQSRLELVSKSIARTTAQNNIDTATTSLEIRKGNLSEAAILAAEKYSKAVDGRISIIEGNFDCTVDQIGSYTKNYMHNNSGVRPVVIVDYLQVLQPEADPKTGRKPGDSKQIIDNNITALKRLSRNLNLPVFVVSSINRSNYLTPIDFESFKESGGIEYTADVVLGLQLTAINDELFDAQNNIREKRKRIQEAKAEDPRSVELVCLKNRYGRNYSVNFQYFPKYDLYIAADKKDTRDAQKKIRRI